MHVITNAIFSYDDNYTSCFNKLFKFSSPLAFTLKKHITQLNNKYISISCRFLNLLGDFNETTTNTQLLSTQEQKVLIEKNLKQLEILHSKNPNISILVNSDSKIFLNHAKKFDYTYIIEGNITHIDNYEINKQYSYHEFEKTFVDFFMIAHAEKIYLFQTKPMYNSGYPYAASLIYNKPFQKIIF